MDTKQIALPLVVLLAVLLAFSSPAAADYSGDKPLVTYDQGLLKNGGIVYETVEDGSAYTKLYCTVYRTDQGIGQPSEAWCNLTQTIVIDTIPEGATVKMARLYNYASWSTSDNDKGGIPWYIPGDPAEADMWFNGVKVTCKNPATITNPINYNNGVIQYWDTKGQGYSSKKWDYPSGTFAWDVTNMVTGNGIYTAKITNNDSTPTGVRPGEPITSVKRERFVTYGFGLLVVYENGLPGQAEGKKTEYWIDEGCDLLLNTSKYGVYEPIATTNAPFFGKTLPGRKKADLITVVVTSDKGNASNWDSSLNMNYWNGLTTAYQIGPSTAVNYKAIGVNKYDVMMEKNNIAYFQDRDLGTGRGDNEVVSNAFLVNRYGKP